MRCLASCKGGALRLSLRGRVGEGEAKRAAQGRGAHPPVVRLLGSAPWKRGRAVGFSHSRCLSLLPSRSHPKPQTTRKRAPCSTSPDTLLPSIHVQIYPSFLPHPSAPSIHLLCMPSSPVFPHLSFPSHFWRAGALFRLVLHPRTVLPAIQQVLSTCSVNISIHPFTMCLLLLQPVHPFPILHLSAVCLVGFFQDSVFL